jgi:predicted O-linked N-acetylglucosamine transferase (SPINDLY family)
LPEQAAQQYHVAIRLKPGDAIAHFNLGQALEEVHDTIQARQHFAQAAESRPEKRLWRLRAELCGLAVFESSQEIEEYCEKVEDAIHRTAWETSASTTSSRRACYAFYKKMQFAELVASSAEEYARKAVQVATDRDYRKYVTERIAQASDVLFNDLKAASEHERFFEEALSHAGY